MESGAQQELSGGRRFLKALSRGRRKINNRIAAWNAWWCREDLIRVGQLFGTDKWGAHWYLQHYHTHFHPLRLKQLNILEIGVGGYDNPDLGGESLRTWKTYFPNSQIYGIDLYDKARLDEKRIKTFRGSQIDEAFLQGVFGEIGQVDIIIDDGSHVNQHVIRTFEILFPLLKNPGIYVIEDVQTSYWPGFGGTSGRTSTGETIMGYFTHLVHCLNHAEILDRNYVPTYFDRHIIAMHFYHNLVFIHKGDNSEGSNVLRHNSTDASFVLGAPASEHLQPTQSTPNRNTARGDEQWPSPR